MEFLQDLCEGKLFGSGKSNLQYYTGKDITEFVFMQLLGIQIMKYETGALPEVQKYVKGIGNLMNYNYWRSGKNELYLMFHLLVGKYSHEQRLLLSGRDSMEFLDKTRVNTQNLARYFRMVVAGRFSVGFDRRFMLEMERGLRITDGNLKIIRRIASSWDIQSYTTKKVTLTRLLQLFRSKCRRSELLPYLESLAIAMNLENRALPPLKDESIKAQKTPVKPDMRFLRNLSAGIAAGDSAAQILARKKKK